MKILLIVNLITLAGLAVFLTVILVSYRKANKTLVHTTAELAIAKDERDDLLVYKDNHNDARIYFNGFRESDIPEKLNGYFISHYDTDSDNIYYDLTPIDRFIKDLDESIKEYRKVLRKQEEVLIVLNNICKEGV